MPGNPNTRRVARPRRRTVRALLYTLSNGLALCLATGCISYTVGQGAETTPRGERSFGSSVNMVPGTLREGEGGASTRRPSVDSDVRFGIDEQSDIGVRLATYSGFMVTYKRQLGRPDVSPKAPENRSRTAFMLGGGIINGAEHAAMEATLITSAPWTSAGQFYGAFRAIQVLPITSSARKDDPAVGFAIGHLFGDRNSSIGPEIGVYYDRSTLNLNQNRILVIPSLVIRRTGIGTLGGFFK
jgi:hypothetical protein